MFWIAIVLAILAFSIYIAVVLTKKRTEHTIRQRHYIDEFYKHANKVADDEKMDDVVKSFIEHLSENMMDGQHCRDYVKDILTGKLAKRRQEPKVNEGYHFLMKSVGNMTKKSQNHFDMAFSAFLIGITFNSLFCGSFIRMVIQANYNLKKKSDIEDALKRTKDLYDDFNVPIAA